MSEQGWEQVSSWYQGIVGKEGHYYHKSVIMPGVLRLLQLDSCPDPNLLDIACGQGITARYLPKALPYTGVDISPAMIAHARKLSPSPHHRYLVADASMKLPLSLRSFSHVIIILALQNISTPQKVIENAGKLLRPGGHLVVVLNHPCFRIPRQSSWGIDEERKIQFRRIDRYLTPLTIPIAAHPSRGSLSEQTASYHHPLSDYVKWMVAAGFTLNALEEWTSDKASTGKHARMENRARLEFPLFLAMRAVHDTKSLER